MSVSPPTVLPAASRAPRVVLAVLVVLNVAIVWLTPVFPGHDLPKHVAGARLFADLGGDTLLDAHFVRAPGLLGYYGLHRLLGAAGRVVGLAVVLRLCLTAYVIGMLLGFAFLVRSWRTPAGENAPESTWVSLLGVLVLWSPVVLYGFFTFFLAIPCFFVAAGMLVRAARPGATGRARLGAGLAGLPLALLHPVAALAILWFAALYALAVRTRRATMAALLVAVPPLVLLALFSATVVAHGPQPAARPWAIALLEADGLDSLNRFFGLTWTSPPMLVSYLGWTVLGPYRPLGLLLNGVALGAVVLVAWRAWPAGAPRGDAADPALRRAVLWFAVSVLLCPWGFERPDRVQLLNLRLMTLAFGLGLALVDERWFAARRARVALTAMAIVVSAHFGVNAVRFGREAREVVELMRRASPPGVMTSMACHRTSPYFAGVFKLTADLPLYYMGLMSGLSAQFEPELSAPVRYRPGQRPFNPGFDRGWGLARENLTPGGYVMIEWPDPGDAEFFVAAVPALQQQLASGTDRVACSGRWCLHRVRPR